MYKLLIPPAALLLFTACPTGGGGGGITIQQNDATSPELSLGAGQSGGQNVSVSATGSAQTMSLVSRTGPLNVLATARDPESGVQALEIWVNKRSTSCQAAGPCSTKNPGLLSAPTFHSTSAQKQPGEQTAESSTMAQALDLATEIGGAAPSGGSLTVSLEIYAVAVNHAGGRTQTPTITATWKEP